MIDSRDNNIRNASFFSYVIKVCIVLACLIAVYILVGVYTYDGVIESSSNLLSNYGARSKADFYSSYIEASNTKTEEVQTNTNVTTIDDIVINEGTEFDSWSEEKQLAAKYVYKKFYVEEGYPIEFVCGVIGNVYCEGGLAFLEYSFNSTWEALAARNGFELVPTSYAYKFDNIRAAEAICTYDNTKSMGVGLVQWSFGRRGQLLEYYKKYQGSDGSLSQDALAQAELDFMLFELKGTYETKVYKAWESSIQGVNDIDLKIHKAAGVFCAKYEVCAGYKSVRNDFTIPSDAKVYERYEAAIVAYEAFVGKIK